MLKVNIFREIFLNDKNVHQKKDISKMLITVFNDFFPEVLNGF